MRPQFLKWPISKTGNWFFSTECNLNFSENFYTWRSVGPCSPCYIMSLSYLSCLSSKVECNNSNFSWSEHLLPLTNLFHLWQMYSLWNLHIKINSIADFKALSIYLTENLLITNMNDNICPLTKMVWYSEFTCLSTINML